jgi:hypothetical protein
VSSFYSVVQFVPDPIRDERMNFGVVVFDDDVVRCQFLRDWGRLSTFSQSDVSFLREFAESMQAASPGQPSLLADSPIWTPDAIREAAGRWMNSIQMTQPRASTLDTEALLPRMSERFLPQPIHRRRQFRDRRAAIGLARSNLGAALDAVSAPDKEIVIAQHVEIDGALGQHTFDLGLRNGRLLQGIQGISFEGHARNEMSREVDATAWTIDDVRKSNHDLAITVVALPPRTSSKSFDTARRIFDGLGARVVEEPDIESWAQESIQAATVA